MSNGKLTAAATGLAALALLMMPLMLSSARAGDVRSTSCVGAGDSYSCVTSWSRAPKDPHSAKVPDLDSRELAEARIREQRWLARCRPVVHQDRFGVPRYQYAAAGCEFGKYE
jgi:hypothetical protein